MVDGLINEIAEGTPPFRSAQCGSLGQKGFQVRKARQANAAVHACMHKHTAVSLFRALRQHAMVH
jgi:hypothetical protein